METSEATKWKNHLRRRNKCIVEIVDESRMDKIKENKGRSICYSCGYREDKCHCNVRGY